MPKVETATGAVSINRLPDECPVCQNGIDPIPLIKEGYKAGPFGRALHLVFRCPKHNCSSVFIAEYMFTEESRGLPDSYHLSGYAPTPRKKVKFPDCITELSGSFETIYNQALQAETLGLDQVCGCGYRKALEFLIKDYAIHCHPKEKDVILEKFLGPTIQNYIDDPRIKANAERAAWLGNDETHYTRKWTNFDLEDLKHLIKLSVNWIESDLLTEQYKVKMQRRQK